MDQRRRRGEVAAAPEQALSSSTVSVAQIEFWQTASRRVPWQVVVEVGSAHAGDPENAAGQSAATPQQLPVSQQKPLSQWPEAQDGPLPGVHGWPFVIWVTCSPEGREQAARTAPPARRAEARTRWRIEAVRIAGSPGPARLGPAERGRRTFTERACE